MKNILAINLSPRKNGTSALLLSICAEYLSKRGHKVQSINLHSHLEDFQRIRELVRESDTIILSGPCYTLTYPADTILLLEELEAHPGILHGQNLYGIIQGGMPYVHTHVSGLNMLKIFAGKVNISYKGGFVMGMGAMLDGRPLVNLPNGKKVIRQMDIFCEHIHNGTVSPDSVYEVSILKMPGVITWSLAKIMNRKINKDFAKRGINASGPSPYASDELM